MTMLGTDELETMAVYGETSVGWDEKSLPNETVDENGSCFVNRPGFAAVSYRHLTLPTILLE